MLACLTLALCLPAAAQTVDDSVMVDRKALFTGVLYGHDSWTEYWEGTLKRENGNVGKLSTNAVTWMANYGVTPRLNVMLSLPYVDVEASGGTLQEQSGLQDLTLAAKFRAFQRGDLTGFASAAFSFPVSDYVFDVLPVAIGLHSTRLSGRALLNYRRGWLFGDGTAAYTIRDNVTLDRDSYFTDGQLFFTSEVEMPDVFDYTFRAGYMGHGLMAPVYFTQQKTLGGGDIRRQDMAFVSNKMNFSRVGVMAMYTLPRPADLAVRAEWSRVFDGRNVGESTTFSAGLLYTFRFSHK
jgi:hypothetical protein